MWSSQLAYSSDIFCRLNKLNLVDVFDVQNKINGMLKKMELFEIEVKLASFVFDKDPTLDDGVRDIIVTHLILLRQQFYKYFPVTTETNNWMRNLFHIETSEMPKDFTVGVQ